jgi:hypothetical protein
MRSNRGHGTSLHFLDSVSESGDSDVRVGQALLRDKSQITTATFYKKAVTPETLRAGVKMLEAAAKSDAANGK